MVSVGVTEVLTILLVVLVVFGPRRLPELARRAGRMARDVRSALTELRAGIEGEAGVDGDDRLDDVRRNLGPTLGGDAPGDGTGDDR